VKRNTHILFSLLVTFIFLSLSLPANALPADFYAGNSVLAEGRWTRIEASKTGMQLIPAATLRAMGFRDISKVNVYGTGGRMVPESLGASMSDDLPLLPCVRTSKGIIFFATDNITWKPQRGSVPYSHVMNPYSDKSYYFLSDRETTGIEEIPSLPAPGNETAAITSFMERMLHETETTAPAETGRVILGEDFRSQRNRTFPFLLTGATGGNAIMRVSFGASSANPSSIIVNANGNALPASTSDNIPAVQSGEFMRLISSTKTIENPETNLSVGISYTATGVPSFAALNYIEIFYPRALKLEGSSLHFYTNETSASAAEIEGCSLATVFWDVTDPTSPRNVTAALDGTKARIAVEEGYHEYVAFNPEMITAPGVTWQRVENQNIHGMETPDMVIISYDTYMDGARRIARLHEEHDGMKVAVLTPETIYNEFSGGSADVSAFRKMLKMWYDRSGDGSIKYCLLMGRPYFDNKCVTPDARALGYRPLPIWEEGTSFTEIGSYSTDSYIAMLDDCSESFNMSSAQQRVGVGRLPVKSAKEANDIAAKIEKYVKEPAFGSWRNKVMLIADDIDSADYADSKPDSYNTFFDQSMAVYDILNTTNNGNRFVFDRVFLDSHKLEYTSVGLAYPTAKARMLANWNEGVIFTNYLGHAAPTSWSHEKLLEWEDINSFSNKNLTFLFGGTCSFAKWDCNFVSGGEIMVLNPTAGAIGMIMPSRTVYITPNYQLNRAMAPYFFKQDEDGKPFRVGDTFRMGMNATDDQNKLRYCLIADPAIALPVPSRYVEIRKIGGTEVSDSELPEIPALGKVMVEGVICNPDGSVDESFTGNLDLILFDAEKVVETKDYGKGLNRTYNDRKTKLTSSTTKVEKGVWSGRLLLPAEIENNYSPALISAYAWNESDGSEAHGSCENLYVYGYETEEEPDDKAPVIENFYLNSTAFTDGGLVNSNPIAFAYISDESGINLSNAGIGHKMVLTLDGKKIYDDVNNYFSNDPLREGAGNICYPLEDITPGKHQLTLSVYDNANNSATSSIEFNVGAAVDPVISDLSTNVNPASTSVIFSVTIDRPNTAVNCLLEVFDLSGRRVWSSDSDVTTDMQSTLRTEWNLKDNSGARVARGIYLYRATIRTAEGTYSSKTRKLAVTAQ